MSFLQVIRYRRSARRVQSVNVSHYNITNFY